MTEFIYTKGNKTINFHGRLVGVITDKEAQALMNTNNAPRAVFTSSEINPKEIYLDTNKKRLVIASTTLKRNKRVILITPHVYFKYIRYAANKESVCFRTDNDEEYSITVGKLEV